MADNVISFQKKKPGPSRHLSTFHVYENHEGNCEVVAEGNGPEPSSEELMEWLRNAIWAQIDKPIAVVIMNEDRTIVDADDSYRTELESWEILKDTIVKAAAEKRAKDA